MMSNTENNDYIAFLLIRHAYTTANKEHLMCGITNTELTEEGKQKANDKRIKLNTEIPDFNTISRVYVSDHDRTYDTAKIIFPDADISRSSRLNEINFGTYEAFSYNQLPDEIQYNWCFHIDQLTFPNGDNVKQRAEDFYQCLKEICQKETKQFAIVSSCTPIRLFLCIIAGNCITEFRKLSVNNLDAFKICYDRKKEKFYLYEKL